MTARAPALPDCDAWSIIDLLDRHRFRFGTEAELQDDIGYVLETAAIPHEREVRLTSGDRIDFMIAARIGLEVKVDGGISALTRQLHRYAQVDAVKELLVVTSRARHANLPTLLSGTPVRVYALPAL